MSYRIIKLTMEEPQRTTVAATRQISIAHALRLMKKAADKHLLPGYAARKDQTVIGGYYADANGDCIVCENL